MNAGAAQDFLNYLRDNPERRARLQEAVLEDIIAAGAAAGYTFTAHEFEGGHRKRIRASRGRKGLGELMAR